mgnify:CR=1 FL=1
MDERKIDDVRTWRAGDEIRVEAKAKVLEVTGDGRRVYLDHDYFSTLFANADGRLETADVRVRDIVPATVQDGIYVLESVDGRLPNALGFLRNNRLYLTFRDAAYDSGYEYNRAYKPVRLIEAIDFSGEIK